MVDREKVINGLECCADDKPFYHAYCDECPYNGRKPDNMGGCTKLYRDALELLKEQEPVKPIRLENWWKCPSCSGSIVANMNYCPRCGKTVKWDG